jgi:hypothetical protein
MWSSPTRKSSPAGARCRTCSGEALGRTRDVPSTDSWGPAGLRWSEGRPTEVEVAGGALLRCRHDEVRPGARCQCTGCRTGGAGTEGGRRRTESSLTSVDAGPARSCPPQPCLGGDGVVRWPGDGAVVLERSRGTWGGRGRVGRRWTVREVEFAVAAATTACYDRDRENGGALCGFAFEQGTTTRHDRAR